MKAWGTCEKTELEDLRGLGSHNDVIVQCGINFRTPISKLEVKMETWLGGQMLKDLMG